VTLEINYKNPYALKLYEKNSRTHSKEQVAQIVASIREFGWTNPILLDESDEIIAGHGRLMAALEMGSKEVPTITLSDLTDEQKRAYTIADNKLALNAGWDVDVLSEEVARLVDEDFNIDLLGFDTEELHDLLFEDEGQTDPDDVPDVSEAEPVAQTGDIWILGNHRLMCGDSTSGSDTKRLFDGAAPHLMVTDPPYGVNYDPDWRNNAERSDGTKIGASAIGAVTNDSNADWSSAWALFPGDVAYVWHAPGSLSSVVCQSLQKCQFDVRMQIIWAKNYAPIGRGNYHVKHEPCWYAVRKGKKAHWSGGRKQNTVWEIPKPQKSETGHSTQKPVECMKRPIENNSKPGDAVYDPFVGSGTTLIAAEMTGRHCYAMEISPQYCDIVVKRWEDYTGKKAERLEAEAA